MPPQITKVNQDLFISYSRKDKIFVQRLCGALAGFKQTIWVDFEDILPTEEWLRKIFYGIEAANNFIFIISPDSINSNICSREITHALENHKRLIPLLHREIDSTVIPDPLASRNWIFFRETDDFDVSIQTLFKAINTDPEWVNRHTRLQVRALEWDEKKQSASLVLTSGELREAETWLNQASQHGEPQPTILQIDYIHSSRKIARLRQRILYATTSIILGITSVLGWYGWQQRNYAAKEAQGVLARKLASEARLAIDQEDASPIGILLAIESMRLARSPDTDQAIRQNLLMRWHPLREISTGQDVQAMAFSPDGKYLATAHAGSSENNSARIWDTTTGLLITSLMHTSGVYSLAFSQDGKLIAVGGEDGITKVWGVSEGKEIANFKQPHSINSVEFSVDNKYLTTRSAFISGNTKNNVQIWDLSDKKASPRIQPKAKGDHTFDGKLTMEHEPNNAPVLLETESGLELGRLPYSRGVYAADLSGDGHYIATGSWDTTARIWAVNYLWEGLNFEEVARLPHSGRLYSVALSPDGKYLATYDSVIRIWAGGSAKEVARLFHDGHGPIDVAALSPDGKFIATGGQNDDIVEIWDQSNNQVVYILKLQGSTTALAFSPDSKYLATGDSSGTIQVWNTNNWQEVSQLHQRQYILSIAYNLDGALLFAYSATYGDSAPTKVWNIEKREEVARIASYGALTTSPDGAHIAGSCEEPNACIWKVGEFTEVHRLPHENGVTSTAYSPDGKYLATGSWDQKARIWDTKSGREMLQLVHNSGINSVAFNHDGRFLATATGNGDNTARVWDTVTKKEVIKTIHSSDVLFVRFSTNGKYLITGSKDNNVRFHLWRPDELVTEACSRVPRNLSKAEWDQHFSNQPYRKTCPDLPEEQQSTISEKDQAIAEIESSTLCTSVEKIIFSCNTTKNQVVSLCSSSHLTETVGYLQYRFGNVGKIPEMSYPVTREHPNKYFESGTMMYSGGGGAYLKFKNKEYTYSIFTATGSSGGVLVNKLATQVEYLQCQGSTKSEIGPELFEKINIRKDPNELDFIIP